jgi:hypothetical protein
LPNESPPRTCPKETLHVQTPVGKNVGSCGSGEATHFYLD